MSPQANGPSEGQRDSVTSRVRLTCTPGSVRGLGRRPPRSTRPVVAHFFPRSLNPAPSIPYTAAEGFSLRGSLLLRGAKMGHLTTQRPSGPNSSRDQFVLASIQAVTAAAGLCVAFAMGFWVRGLIDGDVGRSARVGPELAAASPPATATSRSSTSGQDRTGRARTPGRNPGANAYRGRDTTNSACRGCPSRGCLDQTAAPSTARAGPRPDTRSGCPRRHTGSRCTATICVASGGSSGVVAVCSAGEAVVCLGRFAA